MYADSADYADSTDYADSADDYADSADYAESLLRVMGSAPAAWWQGQGWLDGQGRLF